MATAFAAQLRTIANNSSHELDLRARRTAHSESLVWPKEVAVKQDWLSVYDVCIPAFRQVCELDKRLRQFERNLFSEHSKEQDRDQLNQAQNQALDTVIIQCLQLLGSKLVLAPGMLCLEWLVRRFKIHIHNLGSLLCTALPHHELPLFRSVLKIVPKERLVDAWKWLRPYQGVDSHVPRHAVVYAMTNNNSFFDAINIYILQAAQMDAGETSLLKFWGGLLTEAVSARLSQAKSGIKEVQRQRTEDVLLKVLPIINDAIVLQDCPEIILACFTLTLVMASTGLMQDAVLDTLMEAVSSSLNSSGISKKQIMVTLTILAAQKEYMAVSPVVMKDLKRTKSFLKDLEQLIPDYSVHRILQGVVCCALHKLRKPTYEERLAFVEECVRGGAGLLEQAEMVQLLGVVVEFLRSQRPKEAYEHDTRRRLISFMQELSDLDDFAASFAELARYGVEHGAGVEDLLQISLNSPNLIEDVQPPDPMDVDEHNDILAQENNKILREVLTIESFLVNAPEATFSALKNILQSYIDTGAISDFKAMKKKYMGTHESAYPSFLVRVACEDRTSKRRAAATKLIVDHLRCQKRRVDCQTLLPYAIYLLADHAADVRQEAAELIRIMLEACLKDGDGGVLLIHSKTDTPAVIGAKDLNKILEHLFVPILAECELDEKQIGHTLQHVLNGSPSESLVAVKHAGIELKKNQRIALFSGLVDAVGRTPLLRFKIGIVRLLSSVARVGTVTKFDAFSEMLEAWMKLNQQHAIDVARAEDLAVGDVDRAMALLISGHDKNSFQNVLSLIKKSDSDVRSDFVSTLFDRLVFEWKNMTDNVKSTIAKVLINESFSEQAIVAQNATATLQQLPLSTPILQDLVSDAVANTPSHNVGSSLKRRRLSSGRAPPSQLAEALTSALPRLAQVLELVEGSNPQSRPELLTNLFDILLVFRKLKGQSQPISPYLLNLCLSSIKSILEKQCSLRRPSLDLSSIRVDIVTDFVRATQSPQVQSTALQLLASLAALAPDRVVHNIMPVFTFMGNDAFSKDDAHSVNVVNQAIDQIIPPLVSALKKQSETGLLQATSGLLSSFVSAFDHIPGARKVRLYQRLLSRLGKEDFGFALMAMLLAQKREAESLSLFFGDVAKDFGPIDRIATYRNLVSLARDVFSSQGGHSEQLLGIKSSTSNEEKGDLAVLLLGTGADLLRSDHLKTKIRKLQKTDSEDRAILHNEFKVCLQQALETLRDSRAWGEGVRAVTRGCMSNLLELIPVVQLMGALPDLLIEMHAEDEDLKPMALRILATQLKNKPPRDIETAAAAILFLQQAKALIQNSVSGALTHAAIQCIDQIIEVYGRKDPGAVMATVTFVAGDAIKAGESVELDVAVMLSLASMIDILKESAVPVAPITLDKVLEILKGLTDYDSTGLFEATCTVIQAISTHIPFMIDEDKLLRVVSSLIQQNTQAIQDDCDETRMETLALLANKVDVQVMLPALKSVWEQTSKVPEAAEALLKTLSALIRHQPKTEITKSADRISILFLTIFETASQMDDEFADTISTATNDTIINFVYKLNDTTFRPIFISWIEWADSVARQITMLRFLPIYFETLKSIVTPYSGYILELANGILASLPGKKPADVTAQEIRLYLALFETLTPAFAHDADAFFANPSHFLPLSTNILSQLSLAASKVLRPLIVSHVIPSIVALARAVQDTPVHHLSINHALCQLRHSDSSHVRLASIQTHIALTEDEVVGDEWISNVVSGTNNADVAGRDGGGSGETMIYVNEMLEDDDEEVERKVRNWVRLVRERVGEEVFEF